MPVGNDLFRAVLGSFPTGVAIVTAVDSSGRPKGLTTNAICSVSLNPPLVLVCIDMQSQTLGAVRANGGFVINILGAGAEQLARRFSSKSPDKFTGVEWRASTVSKGAPILVTDSTAWAECKLVQELEAGDHIILIGSVEAAFARDGMPLMYFRRAYASWPMAQSLDTSVR